MKRISYDNTGFRFPVEVTRVGEDGTIETSEARDYKRYADQFNLQISWLGETFTDRSGQEVTIVGLKPKAYKMPVLVTIKGKTYKMSDLAVIEGMKRKNTT